MDTSQNLSSLTCEIQIIRAKNINLNSIEHLFVRSYLSAGNDTRIRLNSRDISANSDLVWNESTSLDCSGTQASMDKLIQGTVVFELRSRKESTLPIFGRGSRLIGRAEIPWKSVVESPDMGLEKWVVMISKSRRVYDEDFKPPMVRISMKLKAPAAVTKTALPERRRNDRVVKWNECGCGTNMCKSCIDYDVFVLGAALDGF